MALNPQKIRELYWGRGLPLGAVARELRTNVAAVYKAMRRADIPARPPGAGGKAAEALNAIDPAVLRHLYCRRRMSQQAVARKLGVSVRTVGRALERSRIKPRVNGRDRGAAMDLDRVRELYWARGRSIAEVARELGETPSAVRRAMEGAGIPVRRKGPAARILITPEEFARMRHGLGASVAAIAATLNVTAGALRLWMRREGIAEPRP